MGNLLAPDSAFPVHVDAAGATAQGGIVESVSVRRLGELKNVLADASPGDRDRIQYWMLNGVHAPSDAAALERSPLRYELTVLVDEPVGKERPKTAGHSHGWFPDGQPGFSEVCEVVAGRAIFIIQQLTKGPAAGFVALIEATAGQRVVLPPVLSHATVNAGPDELVFSDVVDRRITATYADVAAARGMAWLVELGGLRRNPSYQTASEPLRLDAAEWCDQGSTGLYEQLRDDAASFDWLSDPSLFPRRQARVWERVERYVMG